MTNRKVGDIYKNVVGTVFLLAGAGFVCSTLLSMRAVFADPIAPVVNTNNAYPQANARVSTSRASGRTATSRGTGAATVARTATAARTVSSRGTVSGNTSRGAASNTSSRRVTSRATTTGRTGGATSRNVVSRGATNTVARTSLTGSAIRGSKASSAAAATSYNTYLSGKLYTGNYSNIIDSSTGLISAEAYNNCMESYYTCMDEICTARNAAQRRCACAGRVKAFAEAETALESANEELIKVSGELALLIATKGKDVSSAFQLTDAEKVMNCVSWQEVKNQYGPSDQMTNWCYNHGFYDGKGGGATSCEPTYCRATGNNFGFDVSALDGEGSDILASLQSWANAKEQTLTIVANNDDNLINSTFILGSAINNVAGFSGSLASMEDLKDSLAETWGYELFEYAHNNVCNRVLDSCFNGIYEACGTPPSTANKCTNGSSQCPYNYNSKISVSNTGTYELNFVSPNNGYTTSNSASCFGYTSSSGDPYSSLRGPVADARRSILQKYALDANADCDAYGEQLRTTAQNIGYQKVAAQQALQKKRLEFAQEEEQTTLSDAIAASNNFAECISELNDCYETQAQSNKSWTTARIRTYCAQIANVPHCYETMICNPSNAPFKAVIDVADNQTCNNTADYKTNNCRNIVTLNDILNGTGESAAQCSIEAFNDDRKGTCSSAAMRQRCLLDAIGTDGKDTEKNVLQTWTKPITCASGEVVEDGACVKKK